jgi:hypothetical protein
MSEISEIDATVMLSIIDAYEAVITAENVMRAYTYTMVAILSGTVYLIQFDTIYPKQHMLIEQLAYFFAYGRFFIYPTDNGLNAQVMTPIITIEVRILTSYKLTHTNSTDGTGFKVVITPTHVILVKIGNTVRSAITWLFTSNIIRKIPL